MGRKRKAPRATTGEGVLPVYFTRLDFEEHNKTIIDFTVAIRFRNWHINQRELLKDETTQQFTVAVLKEYAPTEPKCFEVLDQVSYIQRRVIDSKLD